MVGVVVALAVAALPVATSAPPAAAGPVADGLADRLLTVRPAVGPTWVLDVGGTTGERVLARTLQGAVNRSEARLYLRDPGDGGTSQHWLDRYQAQGLVTVAGTTDLDGALARFAGELAGYVVVDEAEPWTVQVGATLAGLERAVVATPAMVPLLSAHGLAPLHDLRGRWPDAASAIADAATTYRAQLPSDAVAVLRADDAGLDLAVQQGMFVAFARPSDAAWPALAEVLADTPPGSAVFGYVSDTGDEEVVAVAALSSADLVLVPSDTARNLSYHLAVGADRPRVRATAPDVTGVAPCRSDEVNVVVGISDGDNLNVPLNHFVRAPNWSSPRRGELPLAWSMSPALSVLAPAAWDDYARQATTADELVAMAGWGYAAPSLLPDAAGFYATSFGLMDELGLRILWSLGGGIDTAGAPAWATLEAAAGTGVPDAVLVGYGNGTGSQYWSPAGRPAFTSRSVYSETPAQLEAHVRALLATPADERPLVSFLSATNWSNPAEALIDRLAPLTSEGVRFLTPSEAVACLPDAPPVGPPPPPGPSSCSPSGPLTSRGNGLIAAPIRAEVTARPATLEVPVTVTASPSSATVGDRIDYRATVRVDVPAFAADVLAERVRPVIDAGYGPILAAGAWVEVDLAALALVLPVPDGASATGVPTVRSSGPPATAVWGASGLVVRTDPAVEDTRAPGAAYEVEVAWSVRAASAGTTTLRPGPVTVALDLTVGVEVGALVLTGTVAAPWACTPAAGVLAETAAAAPPTPTTAPTSTSTTTPVPTSSTAPPSAPPSSAPTALGPRTPAPKSPAAIPVVAAAAYAG